MQVNTQISVPGDDFPKDKPDVVLSNGIDVVSADKAQDHFVKESTHSTEESYVEEEVVDEEVVVVIEEEEYVEEVEEESTEEEVVEESEHSAVSNCISTDMYSIDVAFEGEEQAPTNRVDLSRLRPKKKDDGAENPPQAAGGDVDPKEQGGEAELLAPVEENVAVAETEERAEKQEQSEAQEESAASEPETQPAPVAETVTRPVQSTVSAEKPKDSSNLAWSKPDWVKPKLRSTPQGAVVKTKGDLQAPITHIRKVLENGDEQVEEVSESGHASEQALSPVSPSKKKIEWEKPDWAKDKPKVASPVPVSPSKKIEWQKPDWVKAKLRSTEKGEAVKTKGDLQNAITHVNLEKEEVRDYNFEANPMMLKPTGKGSIVRLGASLAKPITHIERDPMGDINFEANPAFVLKESAYGEKVKKGETLTKPVTHIEKPEGRDANFEANPCLLKPTAEGQFLRIGEDKLVRPITHIARVIKKDDDDEEE